VLYVASAHEPPGVAELAQLREENASLLKATENAGVIAQTSKQIGNDNLRYINQIRDLELELAAIRVKGVATTPKAPPRGIGTSLPQLVGQYGPAEGWHTKNVGSIANDPDGINYWAENEVFEVNYIATGRPSDLLGIIVMTPLRE